MSSNKVVLVLDRVEAEHVLAATSHLSSPAGKAASKLRAALQEDPPVRRYSLEEITERLLGEKALQAGADAICLASDKPAGAGDRNEVRIEIAAALATAFDGATPTRKEAGNE